MKKYGSLFNRLYEGVDFTNEIKVGTGMTEYLYSDRHAYEVTKVDNQNHVWVRRMKAIRTDKNGMSECQDYKYEHDLTNPEIELVKRNNTWYRMYIYNKAEMLKTATTRVDNKTTIANPDYTREKQIEVEFNFMLIHCSMTDNQFKKFHEGKEIKKYIGWNNISFGTMQEYYDYSF